MRKTGLATQVVSLAATAIACGCTSSGLSYNERGHQTIGAMTYAAAASADPPGVAPTTRPALKFPMALAVAQIGEVTPPDELIASLRKTDLFRQVISLPSLVDFADDRRNQYGKSIAEGPSLADQITRMRSLAGSMGADHLMLVGGTIDTTVEGTGLSIFDLTIVGAFIVPSRSIHGEGKAAATLIDVATGRVALISSVTDKKWAMSSAVGERDGTTEVSRDLRNKLLSQLGDRVVSDCRPAGGPTPQ